MLEKYNQLDWNNEENISTQTELEDLKQETYENNPGIWDKIGDILWFNDKYKEYFDSHLEEVQEYLHTQEKTRVYWLGLANRVTSNLKYSESGWEIESYGQKTKIDKDHWKIDWLGMKFPDAKTMIIIANRINYLKYAYKWRCFSEKPFYVPDGHVSIAIKLRNPISWKIEDSEKSNNLTTWPYNLFWWIYQERINNTNPDNPDHIEINNIIEYMKIGDKEVNPKV
jgi:hypothetical protein